MVCTATEFAKKRLDLSSVAVEKSSLKSRSEVIPNAVRIELCSVTLLVELNSVVIGDSTNGVLDMVADSEIVELIAIIPFRLSPVDKSIPPLIRITILLIELPNIKQ